MAKKEEAPKENKKEIKREMVKIIFTGEELQDLGSKLAEAHNGLEKVLEEEAAAKAGFKSRSKEFELTIKDLARKIRDGYDMRYENCEVEYDKAKSLIHFWLDRSNGREKVKSRPMTETEKQMAIFPEKS
jgi:hypothetical protein